MHIIEVPKEFQPDRQVVYPMHQVGLRAEEALNAYFEESYSDNDLVYLPIYWDNYLVKHQFGKDKQALETLELYVNNVMKENPDKTFWTVCEYVDGILINIEDPPRLKVFYCARHGGVTLPLLCDPHPLYCGGDRSPLLASFCGSLDTHPVRKQLQRQAQDHDNIEVVHNGGTDVFRDLMSRAVYAICPRGYGPTSYRLYEAIQMGVVPVYYTDDRPLFPYKKELPWEDMCLVCEPSRVYNLQEYLQVHIDNNWAQKAQRLIQQHYEKYFTMQGMCKWVKEWLEKYGTNKS